MQWFKFFLSHSIFVSFCAAGLSYQSFALLGIPVDINILIIVFCSTLASYNFYWLIAKYYFYHSNKIGSFFYKNISNIVLFGIASIATLLELCNNSRLLSLIIIATLLTLLYSLPLWPIKQTRFFRQAGFLKTFLLAFTWSFVTVLLPAHAIIFINPFFILQLFFIRFSFMLMLVLIFDTRDVVIDKLYLLHSLATDFSPRMITIIMGSLFVLYNGSVSIFMLQPGNIGHGIALASVGIATIALYFVSLKKRGYYFYYFLIDGLMLFSALATFMATI